MKIALVLKLLTVLYIFIASRGTSFSQTRSLTTPLVLPDKPFLVIWNHPTQSCEAAGVNLNFERWGIIDNSKDSFIGDQIALLYSLGSWPYYSGNTAVNGGIPQLGDLVSHLQKVQSDIETEVPPSTFSGLGVIDFEYWRPLYYLNYDSLKIYQEKSLELAKKKFPDYSPQQVVQEAVKEFQDAARSFMSSTLQTASGLRPQGRWGYYGYPRCWDADCNGTTIQINDQMSWVYNGSTGLYPSIYFNQAVPGPLKAEAIRHVLLETLRVQALWVPEDAVVFPYAQVQDGPYDFYNESNLAYSIREPADMGSSGIVLWGSSSSMHAKNECLALQDYINKTLGPFALQVTSFFSNCTQQLCQGHGRCVRKDYEKYYHYYHQMRRQNVHSASVRRLAWKNKQLEKAFLNKDNLQLLLYRKSNRKIITQYVLTVKSERYNSNKKRTNDFDNYGCRCFRGWLGDHCEHKNKE